MGMAYVAAVLQSVIIGFSFLFIKLGLREGEVWDLLAWRFAAAFAVALAVAAVIGRRVRMSRRDLLAVLPVAVFYPVLFFALQTLGMRHMGSAEAGIIQAVVPVMTLILASLMLGERARAAQKICMAAAVAGVVFISVMNGVRGGEDTLAGTGLIVAAMASLAFYNVLARDIVRRYPVFDVTLVMTGVAFAVFGAAALAGHAAEGDVWRMAAPLSRRDFLFAVLYLGIPSSLCSALLSNYALTRLEAYRMSVFNNLATVVAMLAGTVFLEERLHWYHVAGAAVIIAGVVGTAGFGARRAGGPSIEPEPRATPKPRR